MSGPSYLDFVDLIEFIRNGSAITAFRARDAKDIRSVAHSFDQNLDGVATLLAFPIVVSNHVSRELKVSDFARRAWQEDVALEGKHPEHKARTFGEHLIEQLELWDIVFQGQSEHERMSDGAIAVATYAGVDRNVGYAVEVAASASVVAAWTAFETLCGDLWERCLNLRPRLGVRAWQAEPSPGDSDDEKARKDKLKFQIPVGLLRDCNYDLSNSMGTLLRTKWQFQRLADIRDAYEKVFETEHPDIADRFTNDSVNGLSALRNVIVHKGGKADKEYLSRVTKTPELANLDPGGNVILDEQLVTKYATSVIIHGYDLLGFVDDYLKAHSS